MNNIDKHFNFLLFLVVEVFIILFAFEFLINGFMYQKATNVSEFAMKTGENAGGFTPEVISTVQYRMKQEHLEPTIYTFEHTNTTKANYNETLETNIKGSYTYRTLNLLGTGIGNITREINAPNVGKSEVWYRN